MKIINIKQLVSAIVLAGISSVSFAGEYGYGYDDYYEQPYYDIGHGYYGQEYIGRPYVGHGYYNRHSDMSYYREYRPIHRGQSIIRSQIILPGFSLDLHL